MGLKIHKISHPRQIYHLLERRRRQQSDLMAYGGDPAWPDSDTEDERLDDEGNEEVEISGPAEFDDIAR